MYGEIGGVYINLEDPETQTKSSGPFLSFLVSFRLLHSIGLLDNMISLDKLTPGSLSGDTCVIRKPGLDSINFLPF